MNAPPQGKFFMAQLAFVDTYRSTIEIFKFLKKAETDQKKAETDQKFEETDQKYGETDQF